MPTATISATPTAEDLNGILNQQTPSLISVNVIAQQLQAEPQALLQFCQSRSIFTAPVYDGGEFMIDFNAVDESFIRDFAIANVSRTLEPIVAKGLEAIASLRSGTTTTETQQPELPGTDTTTPATPNTGDTTGKGRGKRSQGWASAEKGKNFRETVVNLVAKNDPAGDKGFLQSLAARDAKAEALIKRVVKTHYKGLTRSENSLWKEIVNYLGEMNVPVTATMPTRPTRKKPQPSAA